MDFSRRNFLKSGMFAAVYAAVFNGANAAGNKTQSKGGKAPKESEIKPKKFIAESGVFHVGRESAICLLPESERLLKRVGRVICISQDGCDLSGKLSRDGEVPFSIKNGRLSLNVKFPKEGRYALRIEAFSDVNGKKKPVLIEDAYVYALNSDLFALRPFKTDFHMHSTVSDGKAEPFEMALRSLEEGCDIQSLSDHKKREGSERVVRQMRKFNSSLGTFFAEEVHESRIHIHSLGANRSLTNWVKENPAAFENMVSEARGILPQNISEDCADIVSRALAQCRLINKFGGLAGFNHPYWRSRNEFIYIPDEVIDTMFKVGGFDYFEMVNGVCTKDESTVFMNAKYAEVVASGKEYPMMGASDAHTAKDAVRTFSIIFADSKSFSSIKSAVKDFRIVAVDASRSTPPNIYGKTRFVRYASFLMEDFYARHNALKRNESEVLGKVIYSKDPAAADIKELERRAKLSEEIFETYWAQYSV